MHSVKSLNRFFRVFAGRNHRSRRSSPTDRINGDEKASRQQDKTNIGHTVSPVGIVEEDECDNITSDLCNEDDTSGKSSIRKEGERVLTLSADGSFEKDRNGENNEVVETTNVDSPREKH